jgi:hypothetical protein
MTLLLSTVIPHLMRDLAGIGGEATCQTKKKKYKKPKNTLSRERHKKHELTLVLFV